MEYRATYQVTAAMQESSVRQYFFSVLLGRRLIALLLLPLLFGILAVLGAPHWVLVTFGTGLLFAIVLWIRTYFHVLAQARDGLKLMEHPRVEVSITNEWVEYRSSTGTRTHRWNKIERISETRDFMVLMAGKLPLLSIPKASFSAEALLSIRSKVPGPERSGSL